MTKSRLRPCGAGTGSLYVPLKETVCGTLLLWWTSRSFWQIICQDNSGIEVLRCSTDRLRGVTLVRSPILVMSALKQTRHKKLKVHAMVIKWQGLLLVAVLLRCHPSSERPIFFLGANDSRWTKEDINHLQSIISVNVMHFFKKHIKKHLHHFASILNFWIILSWWWPTRLMVRHT